MPTLLLLIAFLQGASPIVRVDSRNQGRTFYVDTDRPEIRKALRAISAPPPAGPLPAWLPPFPGSRSIPHTAANDPPDFAIALYATDAPPDAVFAHYESALRAAPATVTYMNRQPGRGGAIHVEDSLQRAVVSVSPDAGAPSPSPLLIRQEPIIVSLVDPTGGTRCPHQPTSCKGHSTCSCSRRCR